MADKPRSPPRGSGLIMRKEITPFTVLALMVIIAGINGVSAQARDTGSTQKQFKAAVYAHAAIIPDDKTPVSRDQALAAMKENLDIYRTQAKAAHDQGVEILVFPEDGVYGMRFNRETVYPYLEYMPDPSKESWIPCEEPERYKNSEVQVALSCIARDNQLYLVANIGDKQPCDSKRDPDCPSDGRYQYNTDVAYGPDGKFLARYHKYNLFFEDQFDTPEPTHIFFDTPFGRFGMMTCFDIIFREPGVPLVETYNVTNFAFPTAWMDALPVFPAIGFHSSFARAHGVNFLSANIHLPKRRFDGSGLYGPKGAHGFHYNSRLSGEGEPKLVVADMDVIERPVLRAKEYSTKSTETAKASITDESPSDAFQSDLFGDTYTFKTLGNPSGKVAVCQGKVCCELDYSVEDSTFKPSSELFAVGAFDGLHTLEGDYYFENCALVKCADAKNKSTCGSDVVTTSTVFTKVSLRGKFPTPYVYPQLILSDSEGNLAISDPGAWEFTGSAIETSGSFKGSVLSSMLVGRNYGKDTQSDDSDGDSGSRLAISLLLLATGLMSVVIAGLLQADD